MDLHGVEHALDNPGILPCDIRSRGETKAKPVLPAHNNMHTLGNFCTDGSDLHRHQYATGARSAANSEKERDCSMNPWVGR
jgi:hypothetical protein